MPNSYLEWRNFQFATNSHYGFFFLHTRLSSTAFKLKCELFCQYYAKISRFWSRKVRFGFYLRRWHREVWRKMTSKTYAVTSKLASWRQNVLTRVVLYPQCKKTFHSPGRVHRNSGRVYKKRFSAIFTHSAYCRLISGVVRQPRAWRHGVLDRCRTEYFLIEHVHILA